MIKIKCYKMDIIADIRHFHLLYKYGYNFGLNKYFLKELKNSLIKLRNLFDFPEDFIDRLKELNLISCVYVHLKEDIKDLGVDVTFDDDYNTIFNVFTVRLK